MFDIDERIIAQHLLRGFDNELLVAFLRLLCHFEEEFTRTLLQNLNLTQVWALPDQVRSDVNARDKSPVVANEKVCYSSFNAFQHGKSASTRTLSRFERRHIADTVTNQWHRIVEEISHDDAADFAGGTRFPLSVNDFHNQALGHRVHAIMVFAFAGDHGDFATAVPIEDFCSEHFFDECSIFIRQCFSRRDDAFWLIDIQSLLFEVASDKRQRTSVSQNRCGTERLQRFVKPQHVLLGEIT